MKVNDFNKDFRRFKKYEEIKIIIERYERGLYTFSEALHEIDKMVAEISKS